MYCQKFSKMTSETAYGSEKTFSSWATALVDIPAVSMLIAFLPNYICGTVLCDKTAHFMLQSIVLWGKRPLTLESATNGHPSQKLRQDLWSPTSLM